MLRHIPNLLCVCRIFLVLPLLNLLFKGQYAWAFAVFALAGLTDGLDGYLARRFDWRSQLGSILDPIADKLLMVSVFVALAATQLVPPLLAILVIGRDMLIVTGVVYYRIQIGPVTGDATPVSKLNTLMQLLFVLTVISQAGFGFPSQPILTIAGAVVIVTTLVSGLDYVRVGIARVLAHRHSRPANEKEHHID